ncbi:extracellular solute-binding protein [Paenibacillus sp. RC67]|uniref:ABC transporter substrate-binding protein n=1 Tax=Paenibacillus sp. RC67 TaxID=3039392 RepID=UPI0024ADC191|nr:extracellular solute-binding protein [Paenibacillus sp. RC67]
MVKKIISFIMSLAMIAFLFTGCSPKSGDSKNESTNKPAVNDTPVTLTVGMPNGWMTDAEIKRYIMDPVSKKYPWITVQMMPYVQGKTLPELVAAGQTPDIVIDSNVGGFATWRELDLVISLSDLIKKNNLDLGRFEPEALDAIRAGTQREDLIAIPYWRHFSALYYNKEIFDKFGVPYPKDGMTWDDVYGLSQKLTKLDNGIQYRGLEPNVTERMASQLSLPFVDPKTNKSLLNTDQWQKVLSNAARIRQIPGNEQITYNSAANDLLLKGTLAMIASVNIIYEGNLYTNPQIWDIVSYPTWPEAPGIGMRVDEHAMGITTTSKNKDAAFQVIATITSDEVQTDMSKQARVSILKDAKIRDAFGSNIEFLKNKNVQAIYKTKPAKSFTPTKYDSIASAAINEALKDIIEKGKDVNTALREADEKANQKIREKEAGAK